MTTEILTPKTPISVYTDYTDALTSVFTDTPKTLISVYTDDTDALTSVFTDTPKH